jgi:hypothetical protein
VTPRSRRILLFLSALLVAAGCATPRVDLTEPRRLLGTDDDVRLDASIRTDTLSNSASLPFDYAVTNNRATAIAIAELVPMSSYDPESRVVTVTIGTEVPGEELLPRLSVIPPGQKKEFSSTAHIVIPVGGPTNPFVPRPNGVQFRLNFLGDTRPFQQLIGINERAVHDPKLAADLFNKWVEGNETLVTNVLPMHWMSRSSADDMTPDGGSGRRPRIPGRP